MAVFSGTNIVNDGLVFHFDLQNSVKSWKGKPTTNLTETYLNVTTDGDVFSAQRYYCTVESIDYYDNPFANKVWKYTITRNDGRNWLRPGNIPADGGETYVFHFYVYNPKSVSIPVQARIFGRNSTDTIVTNSSNTVSVPSKQWTLVSHSVTLDATSTSMSYHIEMTEAQNLTVGDYILIDGIQIEKGSTPTRYIKGARLDTATIVDVKKAKTITAQNLTYRQDDTPTFDGTDDYMSMNSSVDIYQKSFSVSAWIKRAQTGVGHGIVGDRQYYWFAFMVDSNDRLSSRFGYYNESNIASRNDVFSSTGAISTDWTYVALTFENGVGSKLYINGENVASNENPNAFGLSASNRGPQYIGRADYSGFGTVPNFFEGEIDQVKIYSDKTLTQTEIKQNFEATRSRYGI